MKRCILFSLSVVLFFSSCKRSGMTPIPPDKPCYMDSSALQLFRQTQGITAGMDARSIVLNNGQILWIFQSAHLNDYNAADGTIACSPNLHNAAMLQQISGQVNVVNNSGDWIPSNETNTWFEPLHGYQFMDTVYIFARKSGSSSTKTFIAKALMPSLQIVRIDSMSQAQHYYGYSVMADTAEGFCYVYGLKSSNVNSQNVMTLARFPMNNIHDTWLYYSDGAWLNPPSSASTIASIPAENACVRQVKNKYLLITQESGFACNKGRTIYGQVAHDPWGPFQNYKTIYTVGDLTGNISPACRQAIIHPHTLNAAGEVLMTYSINGYAPCLNTCFNGFDQADYYRIKTVRLPIKNIDPNL